MNLLLKIFGFKNSTHATGHWLLQRITAVLLIPLSYWLMLFLKLIMTAPYPATLSWLTNPLHATLLISWLLLVFYHAALGIQVVLEDYVSNESFQSLSIRTVNLLMAIFGLIGVAAIFKIVFTG